jgi:hypothetical protein
MTHPLPPPAKPTADRESLAALAAGPRSRRAGAPAPAADEAADAAGEAAAARLARGSSADVLRDCVLMRPGSMVEDVYEVGTYWRGVGGMRWGAAPSVLLARWCGPGAWGGPGACSPPTTRRDSRHAVDRRSPVASQVLKRPPYCLLAGDLVRAECATLPLTPAAAGAVAPASGNKWRLARKEEKLQPCNCVLLLLTNRRTAWQAAVRQHHA